MPKTDEILLMNMEPWTWAILTVYMLTENPSDYTIFMSYKTDRPQKPVKTTFRQPPQNALTGEYLHFETWTHIELGSTAYNYAHKYGLCCVSN
jgi:hypothetical protein